MKKIFTTLVLIVVVQLNFAQNGNWVNYTWTNRIYEMAVENDKLWFSTIGGAITIDQSTGIVQQYNAANTELKDVYLNSLEVAQDGSKWFGVYQNGIARYDGINWTSYTTVNSYIPSDNIWNIREDNDENLWMRSGNTNELVKFDGVNWTTYNSSNSSLPAVDYHGFEIDNTGTLWI